MPEPPKNDSGQAPPTPPDSSAPSNSQRSEPTDSRQAELAVLAAGEAVFDEMKALVDYRIAVCYGRDHSRDSREHERMSTLRANFARTLMLFVRKLTAKRAGSIPEMAAGEKESNRKRLEAELEYLFDAMFSPRDCKTIGERAEQSRRRDKFVAYSLNVLRAFARALSSEKPLSG